MESISRGKIPKIIAYSDAYQDLFYLFWLVQSYPQFLLEYFSSPPGSITQLSFAKCFLELLAFSLMFATIRGAKTGR